MKPESVQRVIVPPGLDAMQDNLACYATRYDDHRPHTALAGRTPMDLYAGALPANEMLRFEPRARCPPAPIPRRAYAYSAIQAQVRPPRKGVCGSDGPP
jgi:hypothetical protein